MAGCVAQPRFSLVKNGVKDIVKTIVVFYCPKIFVVCNSVKFHI